MESEEYYREEEGWEYKWTTYASIVRYRLEEGIDLEIPRQPNGVGNKLVGNLIFIVIAAG